MTDRAKILIVDDDPLNIRNAVRILKENYDVTYATSGEKALELLEKDIPHLILLDLHMPGMDGIETLQQMKLLKESPNQNTPVIMLTANAIVGAKEEYMEAGFTDYLTKPVQETLLHEMIMKYLPKELYEGGQ